MPLTATSQRQLPLADPRHRPTVGMDGAKHLLDLSEDEVIALIEEGKLSYAWNIGLGEDRREIRILRQSIDAFWEQPRGTPIPESQAFKLLLPPGHDKPYLTNPQLQRALNCVSDHVLHLVAARELTLQPKTDYGRGPNGAALITVVSFRMFLNSRRLQ